MAQFASNLKKKTSQEGSDPQAIRLSFLTDKLNILSKSRYNVDSAILVVYHISTGQTSLLQVQ